MYKAEEKRRVEDSCRVMVCCKHCAAVTETYNTMLSVHGGEESGSSSSSGGFHTLIALECSRLIHFAVGQQAKCLRLHVNNRGFCQEMFSL